MLGGVVNATDKRHRLINDDDFAVHPAKEIGTHAEQARAGIVVAEHNACGSELIHERIAKIGRAIAIQQRYYLCTANESMI